MKRFITHEESLILQYRERTTSCSGCGSFDFPEHELYHKTGVASSILQELGLMTVEEVETAFRNAIQLSNCFISLNGRKTKIREEDRFLFPKDIIDLIPNLQK
jgi:hypothetical protein